MKRKVNITINLEDLITVPEAAKILGTTRQGVFVAFERGRITGYQIGRNILLDRRSVETYGQTRRPGGRPKKEKKR